MRKTYFAICPRCGAHLDPGETCDCMQPVPSWLDADFEMRIADDSFTSACANWLHLPQGGSLYGQFVDDMEWEDGELLVICIYDEDSMHYICGRTSRVPDGIKVQCNEQSVCILTQDDPWAIIGRVIGYYAAVPHGQYKT